MKASLFERGVWDFSQPNFHFCSFRFGSMSWRPQREGLLFGVLLLVTLFAVAVKTLSPVTASNDSSDRPNIARAYPGLTTSFEFESRWDKGALWDDQAPAYDLSQSRR